VIRSSRDPGGACPAGRWQRPRSGLGDPRLIRAKQRTNRFVGPGKVDFKAKPPGRPRFRESRQSKRPERHRRKGGEELAGIWAFTKLLDCATRQLMVFQADFDIDQTGVNSPLRRFDAPSGHADMR